MLQGLAKNLCQIFLGYRVQTDLCRLEPLVDGALVIDVLTTECRHNGCVIEPLAIASFLRAWLFEQVAKTSMDAGAIGRVTLRVQFTTRTEPSYVLKDVQYTLTAFTFQCSSLIEARGRVHEATDTGERQLA